MVVIRGRSHDWLRRTANASLGLPLEELKIHFVKEQETAILSCAVIKHPKALFGHNTSFQLALQVGYAAELIIDSEGKWLEVNSELTGLQVWRHLQSECK